MIIRVSPQWQLTIPKALRPPLGAVRQMEARIEQRALVLRPLMAESVEAAARQFAPHGITAEVLFEAFRVIEAKRLKAAAS
jgi:hypothetical protein